MTAVPIALQLPDRFPHDPDAVLAGGDVAAALAILLSRLPTVLAARLYRRGHDGQKRVWAAFHAVPGGGHDDLLTVQEVLNMPGSDGVAGGVELHLDVPSSEALCIKVVLTGLLPPLCAQLTALDLVEAAAADRRELALLDRALRALDEATEQNTLFQKVIDAVHDLLEVEHVGIGLV